MVLVLSSLFGSFIASDFFFANFNGCYGRRSLIEFDFRFNVVDNIRTVNDFVGDIVLTFIADGIIAFTGRQCSLAIING